MTVKRRKTRQPKTMTSIALFECSFVEGFSKDEGPFPTADESVLLWGHSPLCPLAEIITGLLMWSVGECIALCAMNAGSTSSTW